MPIVVPPPLLDRIPEDRRIKLETLSSLLRNNETQRRALLGIGMLAPASGTEAASSQSGRTTVTHSDRLILQDLFRAGALRIAVMLLGMGNVDSAIHDRGCNAAKELARNASSSSRMGRFDGRMIQSVHVDYLHQILDEMQRASHPVVIVLKTTHWADFHGEPQSCRASVLQTLSRSIFRVAPDPIGSFSLLPDANAGVLRVRCHSLHRLIALTCGQSAAWTYLHITGRLYTGDHLCAASGDPAGSAADQPWWMRAVTRMAAHGLSMRLLREMNCCNTALVTDNAIAEWIRFTLHFAISEARRSSPCTSLRGAESLSRALIRKLENAGCILRETHSERLTVTMLGLAALKHQISPDTVLRFIRSAYGTPRCIGTFSNQSMDEHRFCIGYAPPRSAKRIIFDSHRHSPRCRAVIELLYHVCQAGAENEVCTASLVMNQFVNQGGWPEQTIPFALHDRCLDRLGAGEAAFLLVQGWMAVANPPAAKGIYYAALSIVHCLCAALSERPALYRESLLAVLIAWMEKFRNGSEHSLMHAATAGARLEHCLIEWTKKPLVLSGTSSSPFGN
ncbi:hypothetical protein F1559_004663 [Cyanidiococcus yangmingshanensis]|uniref:Uncharacterized protein n=1 Tax=Cyanidiococcus yangmingshanensis TaxID=2690220 RepID=A0A7J7IPD0_9RHOD|nr:hypothetical protein F1559_004663 [Cyanidiococcus yangmingshanensis]